MLEGKSEKLEFQEMSSSPHWKIEISKNKTTMLKKEPREIKKWKKRDEWKDNEKWSLVWSPWNTVWAYLSFFRNPELRPTLRT